MIASRRLLLSQARDKSSVLAKQSNVIFPCSSNSSSSSSSSSSSGGGVRSCEAAFSTVTQWHQHDSTAAPVAPLSVVSRSLIANRYPYQQSLHCRTSRYSFATEANLKKNDDDEEKQTKETTNESSSSSSSSSSGDSLRDTVNRMKKSKEGDDESDETSNKDHGEQRDFLHKAADAWDGFVAEIGSAWQDLLKSGERQHINKKLKKPEATAEGDKEYAGPVSIMVIDESEHLTAWERMQKRLADAPIIQDILNKSEIVYEKSGAKDVKKKLDHLKEDATEAWETSQNPWVYRVSSVYETMTAESPESIAVAELRKLDPDFTLEGWREDVVETTLPQIMEWFLQGKTNQLKPWLSEGVFRRIASEIAARKQEGVQIDTHVLAIMNSEILAVEVSHSWFCFCVENGWCSFFLFE